MAKINYYDIEMAIVGILQNDSTLQGVTIDWEVDLSIQRGDIVIIYLEDRDAPAGSQGLSAGQRTRMDVNFSIWCWHWGLDRKQATQRRDELMGKVEIALMKNRSLNETVDSSYLMGGRFQSGITADAFMSGGEIKLRADVVASTI